MPALHRRNRVDYEKWALAFLRRLEADDCETDEEEGVVVNAVRQGGWLTPAFNGDAAATRATAVNRGPRHFWLSDRVAACDPEAVVPVPAPSYCSRPHVSRIAQIDESEFSDKATIWAQIVAWNPPQEFLEQMREKIFGGDANG